MSATPETPAPVRAFNRLVAVFDGLTAFMSVIGTAAILVIMGLIIADVVGRFFFGRPIPGVPEIVSMLILSIVFLQIGNTLLRGRLTRSDGFLLFLGRKSPRAAALLDVVMHLAGAVLIGIMAHAFYPLFLRSFGRNEQVGTVGQFLAPIWPTHLVVLIGSVVLCLAFILRAIALAIEAAGANPKRRIAS